jgi:thioredoxin 1
MAVMKLNAENFEKEVLQETKPVLVDFYADWCGPCQMMAPIVEEISNEQSGAKVCKLNIDEEMELAQQYDVMSIPTFLVFKNGEVVNRDMGAKAKSAILEMLQ